MGLVEKKWKDRLKSEVVKTYVPTKVKEEWEETAKNLGFTRETKEGTQANLSEFIAAMVESALNEFTPPEGVVASDVVERVRAKVHSLEREVDRLQEQNRELRKKEVGVSEDRVLGKLSTRTKRFDDIVQELINTEGEATYQTLQRLLRKGAVEYVPQQDAYRLRGDESESG